MLASSEGRMKAQFTPSLHEGDMPLVPAFIGIVHKHSAHGYFERVNPGLVGHLKPQC